MSKETQGEDVVADEGLSQARRRAALEKLWEVEGVFWEELAGGRTVKLLRFISMTTRPLCVSRYATSRK